MKGQFDSGEANGERAPAFRFSNPGRKTEIALRTGIVLFAIGVGFESVAGTVITTNLPADTAIINIDARADGSAYYSGDQALWYQPFDTAGLAHLPAYTVQAGSYEFRVIDPSDAAQLFPSLTAQQTNQIYTAWTFNSPWATDYLVFDSGATNNNSLPQLFDGAFSNIKGGEGTWVFYGSAGDAYTGAVTNGFYNLIRTSGTGGRNSTNDLTSYTFASAETLVFVIPDPGLGDNAGGVSVLVSPQAPLLSILPGGGDAVTLRWLTNWSGFVLAQTTNLQPAVWVDVTNTRTIVQGNYSLTLPKDSATRFFRLHKP